MPPRDTLEALFDDFATRLSGVGVEAFLKVRAGALALLDEVIAERDVARLQREELARAVTTLEDELYLTRQALEDAQVKNGILTTRLLEGKKR